METELLSYNGFPFLKELGIEEENFGCFDGKKWCGSGPIHYSVNPSTGKVRYLLLNFYFSIII